MYKFHFGKDVRVKTELLLKVTYVCTYIRMYTTICRAAAAFAAAKKMTVKPTVWNWSTEIADWYLLTEN